MTLPEAQEALNGRVTDRIYLLGATALAGPLAVREDAP